MPTGLNQLIEPQYLTEAAVSQFRNSFEGHPARVIVAKNFLREPLAARLSTFLREEAEFRLARGLYSAEDATRDEEAWSRAEETDKFFRFSKLVRVAPQHKLSPNALAYLRFRNAFQTEDVKRYFERLSGLRLGRTDSFGCHSMKQGDFLKLHDDNGRNRNLALVFYLTPLWEPRFGGALNIISASGHQTKIEAEYNSMVAFDVTARSKHCIDRISRCAANMARCTISGWYLKGSESSSEGDPTSADKTADSF